MKKKVNCLFTIKSFVIILLAMIVSSCSKNDSEIEDKNIDKYSAGVEKGNDRYSKIISIIDYSASKSLRWKAKFEDSESENYFTMLPREGKGSGEILIRLKDINKVKYYCIVNIDFVTGSGKVSSFSPYIDFSHLQNR